MDTQSLKILRAWFKKNVAELPWRPIDLDAPRDPYAVWISETMLQQTQVSTVRDYFVKWMKRFPNVATLAKASEEEVFKYWQGLGYYSRARNILKTAKLIAESGTQKNGTPKNGTQNFPQTRKELEALPGIGAYTAGAILSLAYHQREAILDGNLVRIFSRLYALDFLPTDKSSAGKNPSEIYWNYASQRELFNQFDPGLRSIFKFVPKWSFVLWALNEQFKQVDRIRAQITAYSGELSMRHEE